MIYLRSCTLAPHFRGAKLVGAACSALMPARNDPDKEPFRLLFLHKRNQLITDEVQQTGTVDQTPVYRVR